MFVKMRGISWRKLVEDKMSEDILRRLSTMSFDNDEDWLDELRKAAKQEEEFKLRLKDKSLSQSHQTSTGEKRKREEPRKPFEGKKFNPKRVRKEKPTKGKTPGATRWNSTSTAKVTTPAAGPRTHPDWKEAHKGIDQPVIDKRRENKGCTRCGLTNHKWDHCRKEIVVNTIGQRRAAAGPSQKPAPKPLPFRPKPRLQIAAAKADKPRIWYESEMEED